MYDMDGWEPVTCNALIPPHAQTVVTDPALSAHARPFRHLCPEADLRDAMSDDEFWAHVFPQPEPFDQWEDVPEVDITLAVMPCRVCGSDGSCGTDAEGRALIHADGWDEADE